MSTQSQYKQPANTAPFKYPAKRNAGKKQASRTDPIPVPIHPSLQPRDDVEKTQAMIEHLRKKQSKLERLITRACDAEDNEIYSFLPSLSREDVAVCYALLEGHPPPDSGRYGSNYTLVGDMVFSSSGELVAGPFPTIFFDLEPDAMKSTLAPEIKLREKKVREFDFTTEDQPA